MQFFCKMVMLISYLWVNKYNYLFYFGKRAQIKKIELSYFSSDFNAFFLAKW
jgi:hypothetical protein